MKTTSFTHNPVSRQVATKDAQFSCANGLSEVRGDPHVTLPTHEFVACVGSSLDELASPQQEILRMRSACDLSYEEISASLKLSLDAVRVHIVRARENLRERLVRQQLFNSDGSVRGTLSAQA